jgi:hypothetical protein
MDILFLNVEVVRKWFSMLKKNIQNLLDYQSLMITINLVVFKNENLVKDFVEHS